MLYFHYISNTNTLQCHNFTHTPIYNSGLDLQNKFLQIEEATKGVVNLLRK